MCWTQCIIGLLIHYINRFVLSRFLLRCIGITLFWISRTKILLSLVKKGFFFIYVYDIIIVPELTLLCIAYFSNSLPSHLGFAPRKKCLLRLSIYFLHFFLADWLPKLAIWWILLLNELRKLLFVTTCHFIIFINYLL